VVIIATLSFPLSGIDLIIVVSSAFAIALSFFAIIAPDIIFISGTSFLSRATVVVVVDTIVASAVALAFPLAGMDLIIVVTRTFAIALAFTAIIFARVTSFLARATVIVVAIIFVAISFSLPSKDVIVVISVPFAFVLAFFLIVVVIISVVTPYGGNWSCNW